MIKEETIKAAVQVASDKLPKTVNNIDDLLSGIVGFFDVLITPLHALKDIRDIKYEEFKNNLKDKAKKIPEEHIKQSLDLRIVGPTLEALKYSFLYDDLREMFENLLVSSIDDREIVFPSFVDIIKQLNEDEAKILKYISEKDGNSFPIVNLIYRLTEGGFYEVLTNFTNIGDEICDIPDLMSSYLDDFIRFGLISIPPYKSFSDKNIYTELKEHKKVIEAKSVAFEKEGEYEINEGIFVLTKFGKLFIDSCVKTK